MLNGTRIDENNRLVFGTPISVEGKIYNHDESGNRLYAPFRAIEDLERFAIEEIFRANGFVRVRLDGIDAKKQDQFTDPAYQDFKFWKLSYHNHEVIFTKEDILQNKVMTFRDGRQNWTAKDFINNIEVGFAYETAVREINAENALLKTIQDAAIQQTIVPTTNVNTDNAVNTLVNTLATALNSTTAAPTTEVVVDEQPEITKKKQFINPFIHLNDMAITEDGRVLRQYKPIRPFFFKRYGQIITDLVKWVNDVGLNINLYQSKNTKLIEAYIFDAEFKHIPRLGMTIDLNGCIYGSTPKFWGYCRSTASQVTVVLEQLPYMTLEESNVKNYLTRADEDWYVSTELGKALQRLNMTVELSTIKESNKATIMSRLLPRIQELDQVKNCPARYRFAAANADASVIELYLGATCTESYGGPHIGPGQAVKFTVKVGEPITWAPMVGGTVPKADVEDTTPIVEE